MSKYSELRKRVVQELDEIELLPPKAASDDQLGLAHETAYLSRAISGALDKQDCRALGFPWSEKLIERSRRSSGATIMALESALDDMVSVNLAGGTHHAHADRPQGFCLFNDSVIAAKTIQQRGLRNYPLIIDCDVHQGNGTASILQSDATVFTFSIHGQNNFPANKAVSDLDIGLPDHTVDKQYLAELEQGLNKIASQFDADCVIYIAGADPYEGDRLGKLSMTKLGLLARDKLVFDFCRRFSLPCAVSMAGGYANEVSDIVDIHFQTVKAAQAHFLSHNH